MPGEPMTKAEIDQTADRWDQEAFDRDWIAFPAGIIVGLLVALLIATAV